MKKIIITTFVLALFLAGLNFLNFMGKNSFKIKRVSAEELTTVYFFWGEGCPHCEKEKPFLEKLEEEHSDLKVEMFETWKNAENAKLLQKVAEAYGVKARGVPVTFIGNHEPVVGFSEGMKPEIEDKIKTCLEQGCVDPGEKAGIVEQKRKPSVKGESGGRKSSLEQKMSIASEKKTQPKEVCLHFFYKDDCPQCQALLEKDLLEELENQYEIDIKRHNINKEESNELYQTFKENYGLSSGAYPIVFLDDKYYLGEKSIRDNLEERIIECQQKGCDCPMERLDGITPSVPSSSDFTPEDSEKVSLPLFGDINLSGIPLFVSTGLIAFVDGFNPCSLWLISFLLGIVIYTGSRKKILLVGTTFLVVTTAAYGFFMAGLLNVFMYIGYLTWIQVGVALIALIFALVNIKDYFWYKKGLSFTISDKYKPKIFKNIRGLMKGERSTWSMMVGTAGLALGVVLVELPCTAGFPMVWTNLLAQYEVSAVTFVLLLLLYLLIYMIDEMIVVGGAALTLKAGKFEEKHGRALKLIGGMIMLSLASVMLINPELMNDIGVSVLIFAGSIAASFLIMFIHRKILPKFDIKIGTEKNLVPEEESETDKGKTEKSK
jgi:thiol-disulfide isomerase/thioredoxin